MEGSEYMDDNIYVCYIDSYASNNKYLPGILYLKNNRNVCFYESSIDTYYDINLNELDINNKTIIPVSYINNNSFIDSIKRHGGVIINNIDNENIIRHWPNYYKTDRKLEIITGYNLINKVDELINKYGNKVFLKTLSKSYNGILDLNSLKNSNTLIYKVLQYYLNDEFIISEIIDIDKDNIGNKEYRVFVLNNQILSISRCTEICLHSIEEEVYNKALEIVDKLKDTGFLNTYVMDLCMYNNNIDVVEFNCYMYSGHYLYNSIDYIKSEDILHKNIYNVAPEYKDFIDLCVMNDINSKTTQNTYYLKNSFAYNLYNVNNEIPVLDKIIDKDIEINTNIEICKFNNKLSDEFKENIRLDKCPIDMKYLYSWYNYDKR